MKMTEMKGKGPAIWPLMFPDANGSHQSPVNVETCNVTSDDTLKNAPLTWKYEPDCCLSVTNTGHGWRVDVNGSDSELKGGPLTHTYKLEQFHCHWGSDNCEGSEHTVDGKAYAGELHLVHWNSDKYGSCKEALCKPDGLAVLGILFEVGPDDHPEIEKIVSLIPNIMFRDQKEEITSPIDPAKFLPDIPCYWTYPGSLTTPPCLESVTWILFKNPIKVSENQLNAFRSLRTGHPDSEAAKMLLQNYRPTLPLGNRILRECGSM
ncbi:hypothetical protein V9T40_006047 [Parthenolecanium corni]|uniref:Carbonic anhydrase n=1 Tax=Parthenolecanium corni TaxID=536013 RepID=A0AAN9TXB4_9HEMI